MICYMKLSLKVLCAFSLIAVLIIVIFMNSYHQREGWTDNTGRVFPDSQRYDSPGAQGGCKKNPYYSHLFTGQDGTKRCYH